MRPVLGKSCKLWFCNDKYFARGLCHRHYTNLLKYNSPFSPKNSDLNNVLNAVNRLIHSIGDDTVEELIESITKGTNINVVERCDKCKMDRVASLWWPYITVACNCKYKVTNLENGWVVDSG